MASREPPNYEPSQGQEAKARKPQRSETVEDVHETMPSVLLQICSMAKVGRTFKGHRSNLMNIAHWSVFACAKTARSRRPLLLSSKI